MANYYEKMDDILLLVKWGQISIEYFGFSRAWLYQRLKGKDGNGKECDLTEEQKEKLRSALIDVAGRIVEASKKI